MDSIDYGIQFLVTVKLKAKCAAYFQERESYKCILKINFTLFFG